MHAQAELPIESLDPPVWGVVADLWACDGSLRDVYALCTERSDWSAFLAWATANFELQHALDGLTGDLPTDLSMVLNRGTSQLLRISTGGVDLHCHFFAHDQIELDIDPQQVRGPEQHRAVLDFMRGLAELLGKPVVLAPENCPQSPMLEFEPETRKWLAHPLSPSGLAGRRP